MNGILQTVLDSYHHFHPDTVPVNGLVSLGIFYGSCAAMTWIAPSVITVMSPVSAMVLGSLFNTAYMTLFIGKPNAIAVYVFSVLIGCAGALIWVGQGTILITNSTKETIGRNTGIFFLMFESSLLVGNIFIYFTFNGEKYIEDHTRTIVFSCLTAVSVLGTLTLLGIRQPPSAESTSDEIATETKWQRAKRTGKKSFFTAVKLIQTKEILLQLPVWAYNGMEITFWSGVFPTCVGNTLKLENRNSVVGLAGIIIGVGEMMGAFLTMITGKRADPPRGFLTCLGMISHAVAFYLCYLILPDDSPTTIVGSEELKWIYPTSAWIMTTAFLLGFGDSMYQNQLVSIIGLLYPDDESAAGSFALFQFLQGLFAAAAFFYSSYIPLVWQLLILSITMLIGTGSYLVLEKDHRD